MPKVKISVPTSDSAIVTPIHAKVDPKISNNEKWEKACDIAWLMSEAGSEEAIDLQLSNLVETYGIDKVIIVFNKWYKGV